MRSPKTNATGKVKCGNCGKKVPILSYSITSGPDIIVDVEKASCKHCGCENFISESRRTKGPCEIDYLNVAEITQYIRDLFNISTFLKNGLDAELLSFIKRLKLAGWGEDRIHKFITMAGCGTIYEQSLPHSIPQRGDWKEWRKIKVRLT